MVAIGGWRIGGVVIDRIVGSLAVYAVTLRLRVSEYRVVLGCSGVPLGGSVGRMRHKPAIRSRNHAKRHRERRCGAAAVAAAAAAAAEAAAVEWIRSRIARGGAA